MKKTHKQKNTLNSQTFEHLLFRGSFGLFACLFSVYTVAVVSTTFLAVERKALDLSIRDTRAHIATLEATYLTNGTAINEEYARQNGFVLEEAPVFAMRSEGLSINIPNR